ncbi:MAG: uncharacterized protein A8A55_2889 [Amphiamblys sp. WSBS2006]|nr:MAG: uncharacterized protein A8A55_2889 [Amphiamblys sp. WSBS2006]
MWGKKENKKENTDTDTVSVLGIKNKEGGGMIVIPSQTSFYKIRTLEEVFFLFQQPESMDGEGECSVCKRKTGDFQMVSLLDKENDVFICEECFKRTSPKKQPQQKTSYGEISEEIRRLLSKEEQVLTKKELLEINSPMEHGFFELDSQSSVLLENIKISKMVFFFFMDNIRTEVGKGVTIFSGWKNPDRFVEPLSFKEKGWGERGLNCSELNPMAEENIKRLGKEAVEIGAGSIILDGNSINLLPKLRYRKRFAWLSLSTNNREDIADLLEMPDRSIFVGNFDRMYLNDYAVVLLPKLFIYRDNTAEWLSITVHDVRNYAILLIHKDRSIQVGDVLRISSNAPMQVLKKLAAGREMHKAIEKKENPGFTGWEITKLFFLIGLVLVVIVIGAGKATAQRILLADDAF